MKNPLEQQIQHARKKKIRSELNKVLQADWQTQQQKLRSEMETRIKRRVTRMGMET